MATLRGRIGTTSILNPTVLVYVTGGLAMGQQDVTGVVNGQAGRGDAQVPAATGAEGAGGNLRAAQACQFISVQL